MRVTDYSTAILELIRDGMSVDTALLNLKRMLESRGHSRLYPKILKQLEREGEKQKKRETLTLVLADEGDRAKLKEDIDSALLQMKAKEYDTKIDPTITGGFIIEGGEQRIDHSYKRRLLTLYRSLIES